MVNKIISDDVVKQVFTFVHFRQREIFDIAARRTIRD